MRRVLATLSKPQPSRAVRRAGFWLLAAAAIGRFAWIGMRDGVDLVVYQHATEAWVAGRTPYGFLDEVYGFVFKYPPWFLPLIGWMPWAGFAATKATWLALELGAIAYAIRWTMLAGASTARAVGVAAAFWWIWLGHVSAGQVTLLILWAGLWASRADHRSARSARTAIFWLAVTAKIFPIVAIQAVGRRAFAPRALAWVAGLLLALHAIYLGVNWSAGGTETLVTAYQDWARAAASGGAKLGAEWARGPGNHGFVALIQRVLDPEGTAVGRDILVFVALSVALSLAWRRACRRLGAPEAFAGWLALSVVCLPLAWHHSFVLAYPLATLAYDRARRSADRAAIALACAGIAAIGLILPQTLGSAAVRPLELAGLKSWGVVLCAAALVRAARRSPRAAVPTPELAIEHAKGPATEPA